MTIELDDFDPLGTAETFGRGHYVPICHNAPEHWESTDLQVHLHARRFCLECPLQTPCLRLAQRQRIADGTWGGSLFKAGRHVRQRAVRVTTRAAIVEALCALGMLAFMVGFPLALFMIGTSR